MTKILCKIPSVYLDSGEPDGREFIIYVDQTFTHSSWQSKLPSRWKIESGNFHYSHNGESLWECDADEEGNNNAEDTCLINGIESALEEKFLL